MTPIEYSKRFKDYLFENNLKYSELAEKLGVNTKTVSRVVNNKPVRKAIYTIFDKLTVTEEKEESSTNKEVVKLLKDINSSISNFLQEVGE